MACLIPKLRHHFAEFLNKSSPNRLRILSSPTCVGLRYGLISNSLRSFSWKHGITDFVIDSSSRLRVNNPADLPTRSPYSLKPGQPIPGPAILLRHSFGQTLNTKYRNINLLPIAYAFRPRLRIRLTLGGVTWPRNP